MITRPDHPASELTKREEFAKAALVGLLAALAKPIHASRVAAEAVCAADALIHALNVELVRDELGNVKCAVESTSADAPINKFYTNERTEQ